MTIALFVLADVYDEVCPDIEGKGLDCECVGGGRIEHDPVKKKLQIYGYSQASHHCVQLCMCIFITCNVQYMYHTKAIHKDHVILNIVCMPSSQIKGGLYFSFVATCLITYCLSCLSIYILTFHILPFIYRMTKLSEPNLSENILRLRDIKIACSNDWSNPFQKGDNKNKICCESC